FLLIILGIRGRTETKSPIRVGTAYFCNNPLLNKLGLNPNFTLIRSYLDSKIDYNQPIHLMDNQMAIDNVRKYLNIVGNDTLNPLLRFEEPDTALIDGKKPNIVLVLMESMSAGKMKRHGDKHNLTPFLDSLSNEGIYFENTYSAGIHTYNGIFSTLFSFPAIFKKHSMKNTPIPEYNGIANTLDNLNYSTIFFMTHDGQFDNVEGFLMANGFDRVISQKDYPSEEIKTALGVPDDYLFRFSIPILNKLNEKGKPFFAALMTASDHGPRYIPDYFKPHSSNKEHQSVEYADYSLHKFIEIAKKQKWFDNTLFVFIADHGAPIGATYDLSLDYNHVPLLFYAPKMIKGNKVFSRMAGQIDVYPSIMGLLGLPYENNTLGINLFKNERPYIYFNVDDKYGVIDKYWLLIVKNNGKAGLYKYQNQDLKNYIDEEPHLSAEMKKYAESNIQSYQYILNSKKTKIKE
ncbi:LTA synthase family protein, partial [bacterium]